MTRINNDPWYDLLRDVYLDGDDFRPRGLATKERVGYSWFLSYPLKHRWCNFPERKLSISYACFEFLWYLRGDNADPSIAERATIWRDLLAKGVLQSNYGQYLFRDGQVQRIVEELARDPDSRRATIVILRPDHFHTESADIPCTLGLTFQIRHMRLHLHVHMRSSDAIFGMGNDVPCFTWTQELVCNLLRRRFPTLKMGFYFHHSDSMHIYERHYDLVNAIITNQSQRSEVAEPRINGSREAEWIINNPNILSYERDKIPPGFAWALWLNAQAKIPPQGDQTRE